MKQMTMTMVFAPAMRALSQWVDNPSQGLMTWGINSTAWFSNSPQAREGAALAAEHGFKTG